MMMRRGLKNFARFAGPQAQPQHTTRRPVRQCSPTFPQHWRTRRLPPPARTPVSEAPRAGPLRSRCLDSTQAPHPRLSPPALPRLRTTGRPRLSSAVPASNGDRWPEGQPLQTSFGHHINARGLAAFASSSCGLLEHGHTAAVAPHNRRYSVIPWHPLRPGLRAWSEWDPPRAHRTTARPVPVGSGPCSYVPRLRLRSSAADMGRCGLPLYPGCAELLPQGRASMS